jgi:hypothetical protein
MIDCRSGNFVQISSYYHIFMCYHGMLLSFHAWIFMLFRLIQTKCLKIEKDLMHYVSFIYFI